MGRQRLVLSDSDDDDDDDDDENDDENDDDTDAEEDVVRQRDGERTAMDEVLESFGAGLALGGSDGNEEDATVAAEEGILQEEKRDAGLRDRGGNSAYEAPLSSTDTTHASPARKSSVVVGIVSGILEPFANLLGSSMKAQPTQTQSTVPQMHATYACANETSESTLYGTPTGGEDGGEEEEVVSGPSVAFNLDEESVRSDSLREHGCSPPSVGDESPEPVPLRACSLRPSTVSASSSLSGDGGGEADSKRDRRSGDADIMQSLEGFQKLKLDKPQPSQVVRAVPIVDPASRADVPDEAHHVRPAQPEPRPSAGRQEPSLSVLPARSEKLAEECDVTDDVYAMLFDHQREGLRWLWKLHTSGRAHAHGRTHGFGGILADDMGMGKTMQVSAFVSAILRASSSTGARAKVMIVAPKSVIASWMKELQRVGVSDVQELTGKSKESTYRSVLRRGGVLLMTYGMVAHNSDMLSELPSEARAWSWLMLDEGHKIKNHKTQLAQQLRTIPCDRRLLVTGTPVQNNYKELWSLYDFVCPGLLGEEHAFKDNFERVIKWGADKDASRRQLELARAAAEKLRSIYAPYYLRRVKQDTVDSRNGEGGQSHGAGIGPEQDDASENIAGDRTSPAASCSSPSHRPPALGQKNDIVVWLRLTEAQRSLYMSYLESSSVRSALEKRGNTTLVAIGLLKKICNSPSMIGDESQAEIGERVDREYVAEDAVKVGFTQRMVSSLFSRGHRTLVFSTSKVLLDILEKELDLPYLRIDGSIASSHERQDIIDRFNSDPTRAVCLLTTQVGALGITLTGADRAILMDPSWNPSVDNQAVDRVYRIGQKRDVIIYRLVTCGTIEEKIYKRQVFKNALMRTSSMEGDQYRYFSSYEMRDLFTSTEEGMQISSTQRQLEQLHVCERKYTADLEDELSTIHSDASVFGVSDHDLLYSKEAQKEGGRGVTDGGVGVGGLRKGGGHTSHNRQGGNRHKSSSARVAGPVWNGPKWDGSHALGNDPRPQHGGSLLDAATIALTPGKSSRRKAEEREGRRTETQENRRLLLVEELKQTQASIDSKSRLLEDRALASRLNDGGARISGMLEDLRKKERSLQVKLDLAPAPEPS